MKRLFQWVMAAALICSSTVFTSCSNDDNSVDPAKNLSEKIIGKWMQAEIDGKPALTNEKTVTTFVSATKAYASASRSDYTKTQVKWSAYQEYDVNINGDKVTLTRQVNESVTLVNEYVIKSITNTEIVCDFRHVTIHDGQPNYRDWQAIRLVKLNVDYKEAVLGTWEGKVTSSEGSEYDDGELHRWEYKADGNFVYYVKDGNNWVPSENTLNEYFVDGPLLCTRWIDMGQENREWWEITINGNKMNWIALRQNPDGTTFTATFEMTKVE